MDFINHLQAGRIVEEWYDVPVHFFKTTSNVSVQDPSDLVKFVADIVNYTSVNDITKAAGNAAVEYVRMPFLRCTDPSFLFGGERPLLLVRSQYISLCNEILAYTSLSKGNNKYIVDGSSGVGKSMFIYYFMYRLHKQSASPPSFQVKNMCSQANVGDPTEKIAPVQAMTGASLITLASLALLVLGPCTGNNKKKNIHGSVCKLVTCQCKLRLTMFIVDQGSQVVPYCT
jgi:hypothetical protein